MKLFLLSGLLVLAPACFSQSKVTVTGYIELDGKAFKNATVKLMAATSHMVNDDWVVPIITSKTVTVIGETGTPQREVMDWADVKKTDKSGRFREAIPLGMKINVYVLAGSFGTASGLFKLPNFEVMKNWPCAIYKNMTVTTELKLQNLKFSLDSGRTGGGQGGCLVDGK